MFLFLIYQTPSNPPFKGDTSPSSGLKPMMVGWSEGGKLGLAKGCSLDIRNQMVKRVDGRLRVRWGKGCNKGERKKLR